MLRITNFVLYYVDFFSKVIFFCFLLKILVNLYDFVLITAQGSRKLYSINNNQ